VFIEDGSALFAVVGVSSRQLFFSSFGAFEGDNEDIEIKVIFALALTDLALGLEGCFFANFAVDVCVV
jgi:hypothetical protein